MEKMNLIARVLVIIGALNWGLYAISPSAELVQYLQLDWLIMLVYTLVGLAGVWEAIKLVKK